MTNLNLKLDRRYKCDACSKWHGNVIHKAEY
jgi:hypothetical protein